MSVYIRDLAVKYLWKWIGTKYHYGGDDAMIGWDCSGLMVEILQAVGILEGANQNYKDWTAHGLYLKFKDNIPITPIQNGCLIFWFRNGKAIHVGMMVNSDFCISSASGNEKTVTIEEAIKQNAFVKLRHMKYRGDSYKIVDPFKKKVNVA